MYFSSFLNHDYEQIEEKVAADTGEIEGYVYKAGEHVCNE